MTKNSIILNIMSIMKILIKILFYKMIMKMNIDLRRILGENNKSTLDICMLKIIKIRKIIRRKCLKMLYKRNDKWKFNKCIKTKWHMEFNCTPNLTHQPQSCLKKRPKNLKIITFIKTKISI